MGLVDSKAGQYKYIKAPLRTALKNAAYVYKIADVVYLIPTPEDFTMRIIDRVTIMVANVSNMGMRLNEIMDSYLALPMRYIMDATTNITNTLSAATRFVDSKGQEISSIAGEKGEQFLKTVSDNAERVEILSGYLESQATSGIDSLNLPNSINGQLKSKITDASGKTNEFIDSTIGNVKDFTGKAQKKLESVINEIVEKMNKVNETLSEAFGYIVTPESPEITNRATDKLNSLFDKYNDGTVAGDIVSSTIDSANALIQNFDIVKISKGLIAISTGLGLAAVAMDKLPKLNMEEVLSFGRAKMKVLTDKGSEMISKIGGITSDVVSQAKTVGSSVMNNASSLISTGSSVISNASSMVASGMTIYNNTMQLYNDGTNIVTGLIDNGNVYISNSKSTIGNINSIDSLKNNGSVLVSSGSALVQQLMGSGNNLKNNATGIINNAKTAYENSKSTFKSTKDLINEVRNKTREFEPSKRYKEIEEEAEEDKKKSRDELRKMRRQSPQEKRKSMSSVPPEVRAARRSVAKDVRKEKLAAKKAKASEKMKEILKMEMDRFKDDIRNFANDIKSEWDFMQQQYINAAKEIKNFFTGNVDDAPGSKYIDDCCNKIEWDIDTIKDTVKNLTVTVAMAVAQVPAPTSVGSCFDFPLYKILRWFEGFKAVLNEIIRVIKCGVDIVVQIKNIAFFIKGIKDTIKDVINKIMDILKIKWILDLIDNFVNLFSAKCKEGKELIENTISPVFYKDTDAYENRMDALEKKIEGFNEGTDDESKKEAEKIEKEMDDLIESGESIVAYQSPILNDDGSDFAGWIFYYANINSYYGGKLKKRMSQRRIIRASETGHRRNGGVNMMKKKQVPKMDSGYSKFNNNRKPKAFDAFYWYTKWTTDPNDSNLDKTPPELDSEGNYIYDNTNNDNVVSPVMATENGTLVELEDGRRVFVNDFGVKSGDYILVEGKRYRVR